DTYTWTSRAMSRITFLKNYDLQASWRYRAPRETPQGRSRSNYSVDLGLARDVLKGKGTLTLSVRDLFNTNKWRNVVDTEDFYSVSEFQWRPRSVMLSFTYRINRKENRQTRDRDSDGQNRGMDGGGFEQGQGGGDF